MNNLVQFPQRAAMVEEASAWVVKMDRGLSSAEGEELRQWIAQSTGHREALARAVAMWDDADMISDLSRSFPLERYMHPPQRAVAPTLLRVAPVVLGLFLVVLAGGVWQRGGFTEIANYWANTDLVYRTQLGQQTAIPLPDGSRVMLNTNTELEIHFDAANRLIDLRKGEAYFEVAHDSSRPFNVRTARGVVTAVGTAFNVRLQDDQLNVLVTEGTVRVGADISSGIEIAEGEARVTAGEAASLHEGAITHQVVKPAQIEAGLAWRQGMLIFNEEPLEQVLEEFSRYAPVEFVFADDKLRRIPVVGYFRIGDIDSLSIALENNFQILADRSQENRIVLSAAP